ncbi:P pilus assembly protein [Paenibacillus selenitireducens]|uniref:P pilus assembly protein n=1 Tax=Paenibacillus selenitireducens TaxID=1324314 RepID=A0A1T2XNM7_9BACL|nr:DUF2487 family protein [Paenibacillus selenitireducens]OPA81461.1 P pilus assembly protein [Paenibacillus selenitireducens]
MKFSDITAEQWDELQPYLDTCLLPMTGLSGGESPHDTTLALEQLRDWMDEVENPFRGRIVTYPANHYVDLDELEKINDLCHKMKLGGFKYVIIISAKVPFNEQAFEHADLVLSPATVKPTEAESLRMIITTQIHNLWQKKS